LSSAKDHNKLDLAILICLRGSCVHQLLGTDRECMERYMALRATRRPG
jgi:hypothetical protein